MAQTGLSLADVLKEAWSSTRIQKQFEDKNMPLGQLEKREGTVMGRQVQTPIHKGRNLGGYTSVGAGGGTLNSATQQQVDQAQWTLTYHWVQVDIDTSALAQATGSSAQSVISAKDLEIEGAVNDTRHQMVRQLVTNGDGIVAQAGTDAGGDATQELAPEGSLIAGQGATYANQALVRGWLGVSSLIDIGTTADTDSIAAGLSVSAFTENAIGGEPTIVTSGTPGPTTLGTHFVYIANPNSTTLANPEMNGLRNIVNTTGALGGLNPATAGEEFWAAARRDTTTTVFSLDLVLDLQQQVQQRTGNMFSDVWTGFKQKRNFYSLLQNQVRFAGDNGLAAGDVEMVQWNGMKVRAYADCLDSDWYCLTLSDLFRVQGGFSGSWATDVAGTGGPLQWAPNSTRFQDGYVYPLNIGVQRRNSHAAATNLTA